MKQILMLRVFSVKVPTFIISKITQLSLTHRTKFKVEFNTGDLTCLFLRQFVPLIALKESSPFLESFFLINQTHTHTNTYYVVTF